MGGTVGDYIKRRVRIFGAIAVSGTAFTFWRIAQHGGPHPGSLPWDVQLGFIWGLSGGMAFQMLVKCPICGRKLGRFLGFRAIGFGIAIKHCPYRGVSFDKPML
jgi:hypothetical protein